LTTVVPVVGNAADARPLGGARSQAFLKFAMKDSQLPELHTAGLYEHLKWLKQLPLPIRTIVSFGCISSEPFALLWGLDAAEVKVVEKNEAELRQPLGPLEELAELRSIHPQAFEGRSVEFIIADMSEEVAELPADYFDLAYCENVLYLHAV